VTGANERDEMLERLWQLRERGCSTVPALRGELADRYREVDLAELSRDNLVVLAGQEISLTTAGSAHAKRLIRAHRIGERLIHDVLGREFESGACEFEHILNTEIVEGICTLLGHPRECPHGFPIPEGECCLVSARYVRKLIVPLTELKIGQSARVAYVYTKSDQQLHRLTSLQIRPGRLVKLHQAYPSYVIECEGASIALDDEVALSINVWVEGPAAVAAAPSLSEGPGRPNFTRPFWRWRWGPRDRH
jgi:DtxR family transcriptional regulator, Mn-dependent transcriptional regulator